MQAAMAGWDSPPCTPLWTAATTGLSEDFPPLLPLGISHLHEHIYFPFILGFVIKHEFNLPKHIYQRSKVSILSKEARQKSGIHTPSAAGVFSFPA